MSEPLAAFIAMGIFFGSCWIIFTLIERNHDHDDY